MALELMCIVEINLIRVSWYYINKNKLVLYKLLIHFHLYTITSKQPKNCALRLCMDFAGLQALYTFVAILYT